MSLTAGFTSFIRLQETRNSRDKTITLYIISNIQKLNCSLQKFISFKKKSLENW